jgi:hypothetical protein
MISKEEWKTTAEHAAATQYGVDHKGWYAFKRLHAARVGIGALLAGLGFGAWLVWDNVVRPLFTGDFAVPSGSIPALFWIVVASTLIVTVVAFRPGRPITAFHVTVLKMLVIGSAWLGLFGFAVARIAT